MKMKKNEPRPPGRDTPRVHSWHPRGFFPDFFLFVFQHFFHFLFIFSANGFGLVWHESFRRTCGPGGSSLWHGLWHGLFVHGCFLREGPPLAHGSGDGGGHLLDLAEVFDEELDCVGEFSGECTDESLGLALLSLRPEGFLELFLELGVEFLDLFYDLLYFFDISGVSPGLGSFSRGASL